MRVKSDNAVSNTIGFVLLSGILLTSVAIVYLIGLPVYNKYVDQSHLDNMIEGFDLISENGNNVAMLKTPYQQSELKIYGGTIATKDAGLIHVDYYDSADTKLGPGDTASLGIVEYTKGETCIAYLLGGVFRKDTYTYPVIKNPPIYQYTDPYSSPANAPVLYLPLISLSSKPTSLTGTTLARISFSTSYRYQKEKPDVAQPVVRTYSDVKRVVITITSGDVNYNYCLGKYFVEELKFPEPSDLHADPLVLEKVYNSPITVNTLTTAETVTINAGTT